MEHYDAIVLGAGGIGSAALHEVARRGVRCLGIDRFRPPHDRGSSHGETRVIRQAYFEHPDYVPLALASYGGWHELEQQTGRTLLHQVGLIQAGPAEGVVVPGVLRAAAEHGLAIESMTADEVRRRWPGLQLPDELVGAFEPQAGYLLVEDCVRANLDVAQSLGAELLTDTEVLSWSADANGVRLHTSRGEVTGSRLIITAGAWAGRLIEQLAPALEVRRKALFWFDVDSHEYDVNAFPVFLMELPSGVFYGFPKIDDGGLKCAEHSGGRVVDDPLEVDRDMDAGELRRLVEVLAQYLPQVSHRVLHHATCLYTMSPDEHFIVDRLPGCEHVVYAAGLSGHGFKFAPALGRALAELALDGATSLPVAFLSASRFA